MLRNLLKKKEPGIWGNSKEVYFLFYDKDNHFVKAWNSDIDKIKNIAKKYTSLGMIVFKIQNNYSCRKVANKIIHRGKASHKELAEYFEVYGELE